MVIIILSGTGSLPHKAKGKVYVNSTFLGFYVWDYTTWYVIVPVMVIVMLYPFNINVSNIDIANPVWN